VTVPESPGAAMPRPSFATFWAGTTVSAYEAACIASFLAEGYDITVFSYDRIENLPAGARLGDASAITEASNAQRFIIKGRPNLSHFSDLFRYALFRQTDHVWVDLDMLLLRPFDLPGYGQILAREDATTLCGAIMRLDRAHPALPTLIERTEALRDKEMVWGATGPRLLTAVFGRQAVMRDAYGPEKFFPIHYDDFWKVFLPEFREECEALSAQAVTTHLWNDRVMKLGVWKRFCPPAGSFLESRFRANGSLGFFEDTYPESVMRSMVENWRFRCEGGDIGLGQWLRRAWPSARLTYRRRFNLPT
jgi:hypothetical protein